MMGPAILDYTINGNIWGSVGYDEPINAHYAPYGAYACLYPDTWIVIACETDEQWRALAQAPWERRTGRMTHDLPIRTGGGLTVTKSTMR